MFAGLVFVSFLPIPGNVRLYNVSTGSMKPTLPVGSLIIVKSEPDYKIGDVVTYASKNSKIPVTHRIVEISQEDNAINYRTKGDANMVPDMETFDKSAIVGKKIFTIPLLGFLVSLAKTRSGAILLIVIPATIMAYEEFLKIKKEYLFYRCGKKMREEKIV